LPVGCNNSGIEDTLLAIQEYGLQVNLQLETRKVKVPTLDPSGGKRDHHSVGREIINLQTAEMD
jgi:hypothetical protein